MEPFVITCCSTADLPLAYFKEKGVPFACFHFTLDGKDYMDDLGQSISFDAYYERIAKGAMPTTSQVNVEEFIEFFEPLLQQGMDVLHISLSSGLSGEFGSAEIAREELLERYPDRHIYLVDSLGASSGYGLLVDTAVTMKERGLPAAAVYSWLEENKLRLHHWFFSTDLSHYKRGGRISPTAATVGTMLNICPLMNMNNRGELVPRRKVRGKKNVMSEMVQEMQSHVENGTAYAGKCFLSHSACLEDAQQVARLVEQTFPHLDGKVMVNDVGTVIGAHTGPGTVALFFWGDTREE